MDSYPYRFEPIYKEKIWGGRNLERLFGRGLPEGKKIGESWELADLAEGTSVLANGPHAGKTLTELTRELGSELLGRVKPLPNGRFPLLLKLLDANDILSLQVHPDADAARQIGPQAVPKTECWYIVESRNGSIYKGVVPGTTRAGFRQGIETDTVEKLVRRVEVAAGDLHYLPAGTVHALGAGVVVAEVQTPSDTTYRVTDWGRGREIHVERSMQCIHFEPADDTPPGGPGDTLLVTPFFAVKRRSVRPNQVVGLPKERCAALMFLSGDDSIQVRHDGRVEPVVPAGPGDTLLLSAALRDATVTGETDCSWVEITLPEQP